MGEREDEQGIGEGAELRTQVGEDLADPEESKVAVVPKGDRGGGRGRGVVDSHHDNGAPRRRPSPS